MRTITYLSKDDFLKYSKNKEGIYKFDLSKLPFNLFDSLMKTILVKQNKLIEGIGFNYDLLIRTERRIIELKEKKPRDPLVTQLPVSLENSSALKKENISKLLIENISKLIKSSEILKFLKFRSIPLKFFDIDLLSENLYKNNSLRILRFCDIPLGDKGFNRLARSLRKQSIIEIQLRKCLLTDKCSNDIKSLLSFHLFIQSEHNWRESLSGFNTNNIVCLNTLDLRDNEFTFQFIKDIEDSLYDIPLKKLDLRGNLGITESFINNISNQLPNLKILTGILLPIKSKPLFNIENISSPNKLLKKKKKIINNSPKKIEENNIIPIKKHKLKELQNENELLKKLIKEIKNKINFTELEPGLYIVGEKSLEAVEELIKINKLLKESNVGIKPFLD